MTKPVGINGYVDIDVNGEIKRVDIHDTHLEEDTASLDHYDTYSLIDYNRSGIPLLETVTEPCLHSKEEALTFLETYRSLIVYCGVSEARSDKGQMRCDVNVSLSETEEFGNKVEIKNINSFYNVGRAIDFEIEMENGEVMSGELYPEIAPRTVKNFVDLIESHFYDGLIFHRVIAGFMIQGGGYDKDMHIHETPAIKGEFKSNGIDNPLLHTRGVLSMARTMIKDSASSQFFIMHEDAPHLDGEYAAFGKITKGKHVIDEIANVPTDARDCPIEPVVIKTMRLI